MLENVAALCGAQLYLWAPERCAHLENVAVNSVLSHPSNSSSRLCIRSVLTFQRLIGFACTARVRCIRGWLAFGKLEMDVTASAVEQCLF